MDEISTPGEADRAAMDDEQPAPRWQPLDGRARRVLGVLVEKAKTTPDAYPMTLNSLTTGCNQKSNRDPQMNLSPEEVEEALERLRAVGAVVEVQGGGRVAKYRHQLYEWLGVDKVELAVMAELLLRGEQTIGELRGRAARMEPIADVAALRPILESLIRKQLAVALTPEGRGQIVSHNLYPPSELEQLRRRAGEAFRASAQAEAESPPRARPQPTAGESPGASPAGVTRDMFSELEVEVAELRAEVARLRQQLREIEQRLATPGESPTSPSGPS